MDAAEGESLRQVMVGRSGGCVPISRTYQHPAREAFFRSLVDGEK